MSTSSGYDNPIFTTDNELDDSRHPKTEWKNTITYSWKNVNVFALPERGPFKGKHRLKVEKQILKNVTGICRPGELIAIMGASGAGKTTLLNVLTSKTSKKTLRVEGDLYVNGSIMNVNDFTKRSAYVQQEDLFIGTLTVMEQLVFQANLRIDHHITKEQRMKRVDEVIFQLGLSECKDTLIGIAGRIKGISGGETKRLAFACEVLTNPPLLLCDEPTSGLDSYMAQTIVAAMKDLAGSGKTIISTIHQPSSEVFALFDRVLLLAEGRLVYLGLTSDCLKYFSRLGKTSPLNYNPADFFIATLAIRPEIEEECQKMVEGICDTFRDSEDMRAIEDAVKINMITVETKEQRVERMKQSPYKATGFQQFSALSKRSFLEIAREPMLLRLSVINITIVSLIVGLIFMNFDDYNQSLIQNVNGVLFVCLTNLSFQSTMGVINTFCAQLPIFLREHHSGMYRTDMFFLTKNLAELPSAIILPFLFITVCYFLVNLYRDVETYFTIVIVLILCAIVGNSFGYLISCIAKDIRIAMALAAPMIIPFMIFGGYFLNADSIPVYFIWLRYISWFNYGFEALTIAQWKHVTNITCDERVDIANCKEDGLEVIRDMGYDEDNLWFDFGLLIVLIVFFRLLAYLALLRRTYSGL